MNNLQEINDSHKKALKITKEKIDKIDHNENCSNSGEKRGILVEAFLLINSIFFEIRKNFPKEIKNLPVSLSPLSKPVLIKELRGILNWVSLDLFVTSRKTFEIIVLTQDN